ncbi:MAG: metallophosphoesterase [Erysipelotrichaceae bacterium]|nr:metallophosphoesterase [Erysipelotrichaceae bacterium]MBR3352310.1 metallophosphoesterase [Erysipelotrichaceae bacterium]
MTFLKYLAWAGCGILGFGVMSLLYFLTRRIRNNCLRILFFVVKAVAGIGLAYLLIAEASPFMWKFDYPLMAFDIALMADCAADILMQFSSSARSGKGNKYRYLVLALVVVASLLYGTINMQIIKANHLSYTSTKLSKKHTFVFISDLHYGSAQNQSAVEKAFKEIKELQPDFILLGGDITDEHTEKSEMEWTYQQLGSLGVPVYFVYGNHDRQDRGDYIGGKKYTEEEVRTAIEKNDITILEDSVVEIDNDLILVGREDVTRNTRKAVSQLPAFSREAYVLCVDHSPYNYDDIKELKADLQLSGHTHAGQFFPMQTLYNLAGFIANGEHDVGGNKVYVSPGIGGWYLPYRTEAHCQYEVIELIPE